MNEPIPMYPETNDPHIAIELDLQGLGLSVHRLESANVEHLAKHLDELASAALALYALVNVVRAVGHQKGRASK